MSAYSKKNYQILKQIEQKVDLLTKQHDDLLKKMESSDWKAPPTNTPRVKKGQQQITKDNHAILVWKKALKLLRECVARPSFDTWFVSTQALSIREKVLYVSSPNQFARDWLHSKYMKKIESVIKQIDPEIESIQFVVDPNQWIETEEEKVKT